ncbi:MAG: hypothetical protein BWY83_03258 [bacterium ADurb.Bin478]|nr:MAG: hypothetical protein BWY83_03258 [bacterium ADurb.Bin478]
MIVLLIKRALRALLPEQKQSAQTVGGIDGHQIAKAEFIQLLLGFFRQIFHSKPVRVRQPVGQGRHQRRRLIPKSTPLFIRQSLCMTAGDLIRFTEEQHSHLLQMHQLIHSLAEPDGQIRQIDALAQHLIHQLCGAPIVVMITMKMLGQKSHSQPADFPQAKDQQHSQHHEQALFQSRLLLHGLRAVQHFDGGTGQGDVRQ